MTVKEYFEKYWFCDYNEELDDGYELPIIKCKDGCFLFCKIIIWPGDYIGWGNWLDNGKFFYRSGFFDLRWISDNVYNYISDKVDPVSIDTLEKKVSKHGGIDVNFSVIKYSFMEKVLKSFSTAAYLGDSIHPDLIALKTQYVKEIYHE